MNKHLSEAKRAYEKDLRELKRLGLGPEFKDLLGSIPDPKTDGKEH